tara:strand:- start:3118 stop:4416 length:1299 start_codon:yes stop_codon:yes gene_type:complete
MLEKIKKKILTIDQFLFKKFGSYKSTKVLENIKEAQIIFSCLNKIDEPNNVRFVGGCVRKALCGEKIDDIDLATTLIPEEVKTRLKEHNIKVVDTGILHGTVSAFVNKKKFEITTLRKDISTDGRHANVEFTKNWEEDASRRDFTINAIYADNEGRLFDPQNGVSDLKKGQIKFIGSPEERIQEDYLRILRYFRFFNLYSKADHDDEVITNIKKNINGINKISNERIFDELKKIFQQENIYSLFSNNSSKEILLNIFPQFKYYKRLKNINNLNRKIRDRYDYSLLLALVILDETNDYEYFCHKYKTSNEIKKRYQNISKNYENLKSKKFSKEENIRKLIYNSNKDFVIDLLLFSVCLNKNIKDLDIDELIKYIINCKIPKFPISGDFLKKYGYKAGRELGEKLKALEETWIQNNFILDKKIIEKSLGRTKEN